jgi:hypothetical protein
VQQRVYEEDEVEDEDDYQDLTEFVEEQERKEQKQSQYFIVSISSNTFSDHNKMKMKSRKRKMEFFKSFKPLTLKTMKMKTYEPHHFPNSHLG